MMLADEFGTSRKMDSVAKHVRFIKSFLPASKKELKTELERFAKK